MVASFSWLLFVLANYQLTKLRPPVKMCEKFYTLSNEVARMLKAIHASEDRQAALIKAEAVWEKLENMKLREASKKVKDSIAETLTYYEFPSSHWHRIRTNNPLERIMKEIRRRTRVVGAFPDGNSALMLVAARLRHISGTKWGTRRYLNMALLKEMQLEKGQAA
jgi:transposase-like protein